MRFMMLIIPGNQVPDDKNPEKGAMPNDENIAAMMKYNEAMVKAGVLLGAEGLHASARGARVTWSGGKPVVTDGPFAEAKEIIGGYWMIRVGRVGHTRSECAPRGAGLADVAAVSRCQPGSAPRYCRPAVHDPRSSASQRSMSSSVRI